MRGSPALQAIYHDIETRRDEIVAAMFNRLSRRVLADPDVLRDASPLAIARIVAQEVREFARPHIDRLAGGELVLFENLASDLMHRLFAGFIESGVVTAPPATWPLADLSLALRISPNPPARTAAS
jgi:hypothetical protein